MKLANSSFNLSMQLKQKCRLFILRQRKVAGAVQRDEVMDVNTIQTLSRLDQPQWLMANNSDSRGVQHIKGKSSRH